MSRRVVEEKHVIVLVRALENMKHVDAILQLEDHVIVVPVSLAGNTIFKLSGERVGGKLCLVGIAMDPFCCDIV